MFGYDIMKGLRDDPNISSKIGDHMQRREMREGRLRQEDN